MNSRDWRQVRDEQPPPRGAAPAGRGPDAATPLTRMDETDGGIKEILRPDQNCRRSSEEFSAFFHNSSRIMSMYSSFPFTNYQS